MRYHAHPLTILSNLWRVLYLTIIPILRGFFYALRGDLGQWVRSAWIDILVFLLMIAIAVWRWRVVTYSYNEDGVILDAGWIVSRRIRLPWDRITTISALEPFYIRPFRAVRLRVDTIGGSADSADFSILVWRDAAERLMRHGQGRDGKNPRAYTPRTGSILALSLLTSNSFGGIIFISTFVSQTGRLLGDEFSQRLIGTFEEAARMLAFGLPPAAAATGYILLIGWLIGFALTFLRYKNFVVSRGRDILHISGGAFTSREYRISCSRVNYIDIRQSVTTRLLNLYSLYISAVGYAKQKDDISCIIPTENREVFTLHRERLFPSFSPGSRQISPRTMGIMRYIGFPIFLCAALPTAAWLFIRRFPGWRSFILFVGIMLMLPTLFYLVVRLIDFSTSGVAKNGSFYTLRYSKGFHLHTVVIPEDKIVSFELRQSFIQKFGPDCDLYVLTRAEGRVAHRCRALNKSALQKIMPF